MAVTDTIQVGIVYNAFDPTQIERSELEYDGSKTLADYLVGLPTECEWKVGLNGVPIEDEDFDEVVPHLGDNITLVVVPLGGGVKDVLRIVALVAVVVAAAYLFGPLAAGGLALAGGGIGAAAAIAAFVAVGSLLINMALPPTMPKLGKDDDDGASYGYDGAKNTAREGVALPVVYGNFNVGGNYVDLFTENVGDYQYLSGRVVLSDGEIDSVGEPEINEQKISDYKDVLWGTTRGTYNEPVNANFQKSIASYQRQEKLTNVATEYTTTTAVDQIQLNFAMPRGLVQIREKNGQKQSRSIGLVIEYKLNGTSSWTGMGGSEWTLFTGMSTKPSDRYRISTKGTASTTNTAEKVNYNIEYRKSGDAGWTLYKAVEEEVTAYNYIPDDTINYDGFELDPDYQFYNRFQTRAPNVYGYVPSPANNSYDLVLPTGLYEFRVTGQGSVLSTYVYAENVAGSVGSEVIRYTDSRVKAIRKTYNSPKLIRGVYDIRVRRQTAEVTNDDYIVEEIWLSDVAEVQHSNVALRSVATGWYKAKMTDQLSGVPNITWPVKGVRVDHYDVDGNITVNAWSDNPAWIVLDMLISERRGAFKDRMKVDFPAYKEWADYCDANQLKFNGVFDTTQSLWDALLAVYRTGRATPIRVGSKLSIAVDKPTAPVMLFGPGNIYKDSFQITYLGLQDRANEFEVSYFDKMDRNKQKTIRIVDPAAEVKGQIPKPVSYTLYGVDNFEQAQKEVWYQLYNNRLAKRIITFDAPIESIGLSIGDVAYVQHDMVDWGQGGRLSSSAQALNSIQLDKPFTLEAGKSYSAMVIHDKLERTTANISHITGKRYHLKNLVSGSLSPVELKRLVTGTGVEAAIENFTYQPYNGSDGHNAVVTLSVNVTGTTATIWDLDVIEERVVNGVPADGSVTVQTLALATNLSAAPNPYSNYMVGETSFVKKLFRLRAISGDDLHQRSLTFVEYNELVYSPPEFTIPAPAVRPLKVVPQVQNLAYINEVRRYQGDNAVRGVLSWTSGHIMNYGGVDIYVALNEGDYMFYKTALNVNDAQLEFRVGDIVDIKAVAFDTTGRRANTNLAPSIKQSVVSVVGVLAEPTTLAWTLDRVDFQGAGTLAWVKPTDNSGPHTRVQVRINNAGEWLDRGVTTEAKLRIIDLPAGNHNFRVRTENGSTVSEWVELLAAIAVPTLVAPVVPNDGTAVDHTINTDGSADISFEWGYAGNADAIDGFEVIHRSSTSSSFYTLGSFPAEESVRILSPNERAFFLKGVPADKYYSFFVRAFKRAHNSFDSSGIIRSSASQPGGAGESPYRPTSNIEFTGDVTGTIGGVPVADIIAGNGGSGGEGDITPPAATTGLALTSSLQTLPDGSTWVKLNAAWNANGEPDLAGYVLAIKEGTGEYIEFPVGSSATSFYWSVLANTEYTVKIAPYDTRNNRGIFSSAVTHVTLKDTVPPALPTALAATASFNMVFLSWTNPADGDLSHIEIWENTVNNSGTATLISTVGATPSKENRFTRGGLVTGVQKFYWIKAVDLSGNASAFTSGVSATPGRIEGADFATSIKPIEIVGVLPTVNNTDGRMVFLTTDKKLYRYNATTGVFTAAVASSDISGTISNSQIGSMDAWKLIGQITSTQITDDSITTAKIAANAVTANEIAANQIGANHIVSNSITAGQIASGAISTDELAANAVTAAKIAAGTITANEIQAGSITGDRIAANAVLANTITVSVNGSPTSLNTIGANAAAAGDPVSKINSGTTTIDPGKILISGGTTLASWRDGGDVTKISGGAISANSITAGKLTIGSRGVTVQNIYFEHNTSLNNLSWTAGQILYTNDNSSYEYRDISAGSVSTGGYVYVYWTKGASSLSTTTNYYDAFGTDRIHLATYVGGTTNLVVNHGGTVIHGDKITTGTINADRIAANTILASSITVSGVSLGTIKSNADAAGDPIGKINSGYTSTTINGNKITTGSISANHIDANGITADKLRIGSASGARLELTNNLIRVIDGNGVERVKLGVW